MSLDVKFNYMSCISGCYDGRLYCIEVKTGHLCWAFQTGAMIKGSALIYQSTILVGSYDQILYSLSLKVIISYITNWNVLLDMVTGNNVTIVHEL